MSFLCLVRGYVGLVDFNPSTENSDYQVDGCVMKIGICCLGCVDANIVACTGVCSCKHKLHTRACVYANIVAYTGVC